MSFGGVGPLGWWLMRGVQLRCRASWGQFVGLEPWLWSDGWYFVGFCGAVGWGSTLRAGALVMSCFGGTINSHTASPELNYLKMTFIHTASESPTGEGTRNAQGRTSLYTETHRGVLITPPTFSLSLSATIAAFDLTFNLLITTSPTPLFNFLSVFPVFPAFQPIAFFNFLSVFSVFTVFLFPVFQSFALFPLLPFMFAVLLQHFHFPIPTLQPFSCYLPPHSCSAFPFLFLTRQALIFL